MTKQDTTLQTASQNCWFLNEPFAQSLVYEQLTNMKYTHVLGLDIGHGETVVYKSVLKSVTETDGQGKNPRTVIKTEINKAIVNKAGDERIATMIGFHGGKAVLGKAASKYPEFYQHFKKEPALWGNDYNKKYTFGQLMEVFIRELWSGIVRFNPEVEAAAKENKLLIAVGCPSSPAWTNPKAVEDYQTVVGNATGCPHVAVLAESTAAIMSAVLDVNEINSEAVRQQEGSAGEKKDIHLNRGLAVIDAGSSTIDFTYVLLGKKLIIRSLAVAGHDLDEQILEVALDTANKESGLTKKQIPEEQIPDIMIQIRQFKEDFFPDQISMGYKPIQIWGCNAQGEAARDLDSGLSFKVGCNKENMDKALNRKAIQLDPFKDPQSWADQFRDFVRYCRALIGVDEEGKLLCDKVILTGGTSHVQALRDIVGEEYPECEILNSRDCSASVAKGLCYAKSMEIKGGGSVETYRKDIDKLAAAHYDSFILELAQYLAGQVCGDIQQVIAKYTASKDKVIVGQLLDEINKRVHKNSQLSGDACKEKVKELFTRHLQTSQAQIHEKVNAVSKDIYGANMPAIPEVPQMTAGELKKMADQLDIAGTLNNSWLNTILAGINFAAIRNVLWILTIVTGEILPLSLTFASLALLSNSEKAQQKIMQFILTNKTELPRWMLKRIARSVTEPKKRAKLEEDSARKTRNNMKDHGILKNEFITCVTGQAEMALGKVLFLVYDEQPITQ